MKVEITQRCLVGGIPRAVGDLIDLESKEAKRLCDLDVAKMKRGSKPARAKRMKG